MTPDNNPSTSREFDMNTPMTDFQKLRDEQALQDGLKRIPEIVSGLARKRDAENDALAKFLADRFMRWELPADFSPDGGVSYTKSAYPNYGTNLLTATQAKEMFLRLLRPLSGPHVQARDAEVEALRQTIQALTIDRDGWYRDAVGIKAKAAQENTRAAGCPECGGPADNGYDRCYPPNPYCCMKCTNRRNKP